MKKKSLGLNAVLNGIRTTLNLLFPLITFPYVSRVLQVVNVGKYNFAASVNSYFLLIAALGISTYAIREGTKFRSDRQTFSQFASEIFSINIFTSLISYVLLAICLILVPKFHDYTVILLVFSIEIIFTTLGTEWLYSVFEEYAYITIRSIAFKVISIILLFVLVKKPEDYIAYAGITVFANAGSNILNFIRARRYCDIRITFHCNWKDHLIPMLIIFAAQAATSIYVNSATTILGFLTSDYEVGIYSVSSRIYRIVKQLLSAVLIVSVPRLAMLKGQNKIEEYRTTLTKILNVLVILVVPSVVGLFALSHEIVLLISSSAYIRAEVSLKMLSVALFFCIFGWFFNQCVLIPAKKEKIVLVATIISAVLNVVLNFALIPFWQENAAAFTTIIAEAIMMFVCIKYGLKEVKLKAGVFKNITTVMIGCVSVVVVCSLIKLLDLTYVWTIVFSIIGSCLSYGGVLLLLKNEIISHFLKKIFRKVFS